MGPERVMKGSRESVKGVQRVLRRGSSESRMDPERVRTGSRESQERVQRESGECQGRVRRGSRENQERVQTVEWVQRESSNRFQRE